MIRRWLAIRGAIPLLPRHFFDAAAAFSPRRRRHAAMPLRDSFCHILLRHEEGAIDYALRFDIRFHDSHALRLRCLIDYADVAARHTLRHYFLPAMLFSPADVMLDIADTSYHAFFFFFFFRCRRHHNMTGRDRGHEIYTR